jgi:hypothetical protein
MRCDVRGQSVVDWLPVQAEARPYTHLHPVAHCVNRTDIADIGASN